MKKSWLILIMLFGIQMGLQAQESLDELFNKSWRILRVESLPLSIAAEELSSSWGN